MPDLPALGRNFRPDPRDRNFLMSRKLLATAPSGARLWSTPYTYNQGSTPACTGYSSSEAMTILYAARGATVVFDADQLYRWANANDGDPGPHDGSTVRAAFQGLLTVGDQIVTSTDAADPVSVFEKPQNYLWADVGAPDANIDTLITWMLTISPVVVGLVWYNDMFAQDPTTGAFVAPADGFVHPTGGAAGGHAICVRGVNALDPEHTYFVLHNSWGDGPDGWGIKVNDDWSLDLATRGGDILVSKADMIALLSDQGEAGALVDDLTPVTPSPQPTPVPVPQPQPQPQPAPTPAPPAPTPPPPSPTPPITVLLAKVEALFERAKAEVIELIEGHAT